MPVPGITVVGALPAEAQHVTLFSAGVVAGTKEPEAAQSLIRFLSSRDAAGVIRATGLEAPDADRH